MSEATPDMIALARKIADGVYTDRDNYAWWCARNAALAAIIETTALAAKLAEIRSAWTTASALRSYAHLNMGAGDV